MVNDKIMFPGTRRFNSGVQRQKVGLSGDSGHGDNDLADFLGVFAQFDDGLLCVADAFADALHLLRRLRYGGFVLVHRTDALIRFRQSGLQAR